MPKSKSAVAKAASKRAAKDKEYQEAMDYCKEKGVGARQCLRDKPYLSVKKGGLVNPTTLDSRLRNKKKPDHRAILTDVEDDDLATWCQQFAEFGDCARNRTQINEQVVKILKLRRKANRAGGRLHVKLSKAAIRVLGGKRVDNDWFLRFFARHPTVINNRTPQETDQKRQDTCTEEIIDQHFEGVLGLRNELLDAGILTPEGSIVDARRIINLDEISQFVDYNCSAGNSTEKVAGSARKVAEKKSKTETRMSETATVCWGLDGFSYGPQLILNRRTVDAEIAGRFDTEIWDMGIDERNLQSWEGLISVNDSGMQTTQTFTQRIEMLVRELKRRSVPFPVVLCIDQPLQPPDWPRPRAL